MALAEGIDLLDQALDEPTWKDLDEVTALISKQLDVKNGAAAAAAAGGSRNSVADYWAAETVKLLEDLKSVSVEALATTDPADRNAWKMCEEGPEHRAMLRKGPEGTAINALCMEGRIDSPVHAAVAMTRDAGFFKEWWPQGDMPVYRIVENRYLARVGDGFDITYMKFKVPWPFPWQEFAMIFFTIYDADTGVATTVVRTLPEDNSEIDSSIHGFSRDMAPPVPSGMVRMAINGGFSIKDLGRSRCHFRSIFTCDLKLPAMVVNFVTKEFGGVLFNLFRKEVETDLADEGQKGVEFRKVLKEEKLYGRIEAAMDAYRAKAAGGFGMGENGLGETGVEGEEGEEVEEEKKVLVATASFVEGGVREARRPAMASAAAAAAAAAADPAGAQSAAAVGRADDDEEEVFEDAEDQLLVTLEDSETPAYHHHQHQHQQQQQHPHPPVPPAYAPFSSQDPAIAAAFAAAAALAGAGGTGAGGTGAGGNPVVGSASSGAADPALTPDVLQAMATLEQALVSLRARTSAALSAAAHSGGTGGGMYAGQYGHAYPPPSHPAYGAVPGYGPVVGGKGGRLVGAPMGNPQLLPYYAAPFPPNEMQRFAGGYGKGGYGNGVYGPGAYGDGGYGGNGEGRLVDERQLDPRIVTSIWISNTADLISEPPARLETWKAEGWVAEAVSGARGEAAAEAADGEAEDKAAGGRMRETVGGTARGQAEGEQAEGEEAEGVTGTRQAGVAEGEEGGAEAAEGMGEGISAAGGGTAEAEGNKDGEAEVLAEDGAEGADEGGEIISSKGSNKGRIRREQCSRLSSSFLSFPFSPFSLFPISLVPPSPHPPFPTLPLAINTLFLCIPVARTPSLVAFLDSYLRFRSRWFDLLLSAAAAAAETGGSTRTAGGDGVDGGGRGGEGSVGTGRGVVVGDEELCRLVFLLLLRMSSNIESRAKPSEQLQAKDHAHLLLSMRLFDAPKLLDVAAVFGKANPVATRQLVCRVLVSQPLLRADLSSSLLQLLRVVEEMVTRACGQMEEPASASEIIQALHYLCDFAFSLDALFDAYPPAPLLLLQATTTATTKTAPTRKGKHGATAAAANSPVRLLSVLARIHDSFLPLLLLLASSNPLVSAKRTLIQAAPRVNFQGKILQTKLEEVSWKYLWGVYLGGKGCARAAAVAAGGGGAGAAGGGTGGDNTAGGGRNSRSKGGRGRGGNSGSSSDGLPPCPVCDSGVKSGRGKQSACPLWDGLLGQKMNFGQLLLEEILAVHGVSSGSSGSKVVDGVAWIPLLRAVDASFGLRSAIYEEKMKGNLPLDNTQFDTISDIIGPPITVPPPLTSSSSDPSTTSNITPANHPPTAEDFPSLTPSLIPSLSSAADAESAALEQSKISLVRDIFPDFGEGFVGACLEAYGGDAEAVIQHVLEGSLHPDLAKFVRSKREDESVEEEVWKRGSAAGTGSRREQEAVKRFVFESQFEYDDEYDDSFDELEGYDMAGGAGSSEVEEVGTRFAARAAAAAAASAAGGVGSGVLGKNQPPQQQQQQQQQQQGGLEGGGSRGDGAAAGGGGGSGGGGGGGGSRGGAAAAGGGAAAAGSGGGSGSGSGSGGGGGRGQQPSAGGSRGGSSGGSGGGSVARPTAASTGSSKNVSSGAAVGAAAGGASGSAAGSSGGAADPGKKERKPSQKAGPGFGGFRGGR
ncbi:unnamed protein product [Closterium sp. Naga37s-1]|nr:unnamed protein product [Closterium sp. Naga37s-1]